MAAKKYDWETFWKEWRVQLVESEEDMYFQVGKTIHKKPIAKNIFDDINERIVQTLALSKNNTLVELCCGNGLCTYEFRNTVKHVIAVDFAPHLVESAIKFKSAANITYVLNNVFTFLETFSKNYKFSPSRFLMNDSLAYFSGEDLSRIIAAVVGISGGNFTFLIRGVPNEQQKWNYYNTQERRQRHLECIANGDVTNDGMGRWWSQAEIRRICDQYGLNCVVTNQEAPVSNYRMDVLISGNSQSKGLFLQPHPQKKQPIANYRSGQQY